MRIVPHTQWCWGKAASGSSVAPSKRTAFCIHYDGGVPTTANGLDAVRKTYKYHTCSNGWQDIGYNFLITQDGQIFEGRGWDKLGAHAGPTGNAPSIGVQIHIGGNQRPSYLAQQAVKWLYKEANARFGRTLQVKGLFTNQGVGSAVGVCGVAAGWRGRGPPKMKVPTRLIWKTSTCPTLPSLPLI